jgi:glucosyl-3-phosphoglycerate phosphatase
LLWAFFLVTGKTKVNPDHKLAMEHLNRTRSQFARCVPQGVWLAGVQSFFFLRHGQTQRNALRIFQGADEPLNSTGFEQARQAAAVLAGYRIAHMVCSEMMRTVQTADTLFPSVGVKPELSSALRERNFGSLIGTSSAQIDWGVTPSGGESLQEFLVRTCQGVSAALSSTKPTLIVAHGGTLHALMAMLDVQADLGVYANATPLQFERHANGWRVIPLQTQMHQQAPSLNIS